MANAYIPDKLFIVVVKNMKETTFSQYIENLVSKDIKEKGWN